MRKAWKIIGVFGAVLAIGALVFCGVWTVRNWNTVYSAMDGSSIYTDADMKESYQTGYEAGTKNEAEYQKTLAELRDLVAKLQVDNKDLASKAVLLEDLESQLSDSEIEKARLSVIADNYKELFNAVKDQLYAVDLQEKAIVVFEAENVLFDIYAVNKGSTADNLIKDEPTKEGYHFIGWSLNGTDIVNLSNLQVDENITLTAVFEINIYTVQFKWLSETYLDLQVKHGSYISSASVESVTNQIKNNLANSEGVDISKVVCTWVLSIVGEVESVVDFETFQIVKDVNFYALVGIDQGTVHEDKPIDLGGY